jgi:pyrimidine-nucleoside phosphorylase
MPTYEKSKFLAELMVETGEASGTRTVALLTTMDEPLGRFSGNWVEVMECVDIMKQYRHPMSRDLIELSNILSGWMLHLAGQADTPEAGAVLSNEILQSGAAYKAWLAIIEAQGGDIAVFENPAAMHKPGATRILTASASGYLASMDCKQVGWAVQRLGAGRAKPGDSVSAQAGIEMHAKLGDKLEANQPLITLFSDDAALLDEPEAMLRETLKVTPTPPKLQPLIREIITKATQHPIPK